MAITKINADAMDLTDAYAFTGTVTGAGGGKILQVSSVTKTDTTSLTGMTWTDISGLTLTLTSSAANTKFLITLYCYISLNYGNYSGGVRIMRDSTAISIGDQAGSNRQRATVWNWSEDSNARQRQAYCMTHLDAPSLNASTSVTYKLQWMGGYSNQTIYLNRGHNDTDNNYSGRGTSSLTVMEVAV